MFAADAVRLANLDPRKPWFLGGDFFKPSDSGELELEWDPQQFAAAVASAKADVDAVMNTLRLIVHDAVMQALQHNPNVIGRIILDEVRRAAA